MLAIEEIGRVSRVQVHGLESSVWRQWRAGPFPQASQIALSAEASTIPRDRGRVPMTKCDVAIGQVDEEIIGVER